MPVEHSHGQKGLDLVEGDRVWRKSAEMLEAFSGFHPNRSKRAGEELVGTAVRNLEPDTVPDPQQRLRDSENLLSRLNGEEIEFGEDNIT